MRLASSLGRMTQYWMYFCLIDLNPCSEITSTRRTGKDFAQTYGSQMMNRNDLDDPLNFSQAPPWDWLLGLWVKSQLLADELPWNSCSIHGSPRTDGKKFSDLMTFHLTPSLGQTFYLSTKMSSFWAICCIYCLLAHVSTLIHISEIDDMTNITC